jgi:hypothetical protein
MHIHFGTALVITALVSAIILILNKTDRVFPLVALIAAGIEALMVFEILSVSSGKFRIDVILPAALTLAMGVSWTKVSTKSTITAATAGFLVGAVQLLFALRLFD